MAIKVKTTGSFKNIDEYLIQHKKSMFTYDDIKEIGEYSLDSFKKNTPTKTGKTAEMWSYDIEENNGQYIINMYNDNIQNGYNIAILVDQGHATYSGTWVQGQHYIDQTIEQIVKYINKMK